MSSTRLFVSAVAFGVALAGIAPALAARPATGKQGMVATVNPIATRQGVETMRSGGNAVDAAVAAALTLGVVDGHNSGLGGGCFILIRRADGSLLAIDGRETAPAGATRDMFLRNPRADTELSQTGPLAVGTPGALAALALAIEKCGQKKLADLLLPAAEVAEQGFAIDAVYAARLKAHAKVLAQFAGSKDVLLHADGTPYASGETLKQPDLAQTYRAIAKEGPAWFYQGAFAQQVSAWMKSHGGVLAIRDFADYRPIERKPLVTTYLNYQIVGFPPPSSGGVHVAEILNMLEAFDLPKLHEEDPALFTHVMTEAMKLAFADRAYWLGDPDFAHVPRGLIDKEYGAELAERIDMKRATPVERHGNPPAANSDLFERHTTHIAAADAEGNWVAITTTINTSFGSKVIVPGTGVLLNNQMDDFSVQPGVPNAFGLVGAEANAVEPGKRPLSSMSPTIVLKDGRGVMTLGAAGGPKIITQVVLALVRTLALDEPLAEALGNPRFHHQWRPDTVQAETTLPKSIIESLRARGHRVETTSAVGATQAITRTPDGVFHGLSEPRIPGAAEGW